MGDGLHLSFVEKDVFPDFARKLQPGKTVITYRTLLQPALLSNEIAIYLSTDNFC